MMLKISTRFVFFLMAYLSLPFVVLSQTINPDNGVLFQNNLNNFPGSNFTYSGFATESPGTGLRLTPNQGNWKSQLLVSQTFQKIAGLTFEGSVFIPRNNYKAVMVGFHDGTTNSEKGIQHGLYFFDNGGAEVSVQARNGNNAQNMPVNTYTNTAGVWFDYKIVLHNKGATYSVKKSSETDYTNVMTYDGGTNLPELKAGIQANRNSSTTNNYTAHKDWKIYQPLTLYVNKNASGNGSGDSWENAVPELADALKWAKEHESDWTTESPLKIWVAGGTYKPLYSPADNNFGNSDGNYNAFLLVKNVQLYGGFAGTETTLADRDLSLTANATVLSSDVNDDDAISGSGNSLTISNTSDNNLHVVVASGDMETALLDGFTIIGGNAGSSGNITVNGKAVYKNRGAGIYCRNASPAFNHIIITGNTADAFGGGLYNDDSSSPTLLNTLISRNISAKGAGVCNDTSDPQFTNITIAGNKSTGEGGGMYNSTASPAVNNSVVYGNSAVIGAEIYNDSASPTFSYSLIGNSGGSANWNNTFGTDGGNNLDDDPLFTGADVGNYMPAINSPLMNTGSNTLYINTSGNLSLDKDLAGGFRVFDQAVIDIGAYEGIYPLAPIYSNNGNISKKYGDADFDLSVQSTSTGAISYASSDEDVATVSGNTITIKGIGQTEITANQLATANHLAGSTSFVLTVSKADQIITPPGIVNKKPGSTDFELDASVNSGLPLTYSSSNTNVIEVYRDAADGNKWKAKVKAEGITTITVSQPGNANYQPVSYTYTFNVSDLDMFFSTGETEYSFPTTTGRVHIIDVLPEIDPVNQPGKYKIEFEVINGTYYWPGREGFAYGIASYPLVNNSFHELGQFEEEWSYRGRDTEFFVEGNAGNTGGKLVRDIGDRIILQYDTETKILDVYVKPVSETEYTHIGSRPEYTNIEASEGKKLRFAVSGIVWGDNGVRIVSSSIPKANPVINFPEFTPKTLGSADITLVANFSQEGLSITYSSSNPLVAETYQDAQDGNKWKVKMLGNGTADIIATTAETANYNVANISRKLSVHPNFFKFTGSDDDNLYTFPAGTWSSTNYTRHWRVQSSTPVLNNRISAYTIKVEDIKEVPNAGLAIGFTGKPDDPDEDIIGQRSYEIGYNTVDGFYYRGSTTGTFIGRYVDHDEIRVVIDYTAPQFGATYVSYYLKRKEEDTFTLLRKIAFLQKSSTQWVNGVFDATFPAMSGVSADFRLIESVSYGTETDINKLDFTKERLPAPPLTGFSDIEKSWDTADFQLPRPISISPGLFTYTSSDENVAVINGDMVTITGMGTATITATQAATAEYGQSNISLTLTVTDGTLPVTLISYTAKAENNQALLIWQTSSEIHNKEYVISRSTDGINFTDLAKIPGKGNNNTVSLYSYYDRTPNNGISYYKLIQVDNDGKTTELGVRTVNFGLPTSDIRLFPNPTGDVVNISFETGKYNTLTVADVSGKVLKQVHISAIESSLTVSLGNYPAGTYLLRLNGSRGAETRKIVKK